MSLDQRSSAIQEIFSGLGKIGNTVVKSGTNAIQALPTSIPVLGSSSINSSYSSNSWSGSYVTYWLQVFYFLILFIFIVFIILTIIHYTITPIFAFYPGDKGIIGVPGNTNDVIYWNKKLQPPPSDPVPKAGDNVSGNSFVNTFSFSVDLFVSEMVATNSTMRLILYKAAAPVTTPPNPTSLEDFVNYMALNSSMIMYLTQTNDLMVTFFSPVGSATTHFNTPPLKNVPLNTPFRITVVAEDKLFTVYLNGKQTFQRTVPATINLPVGSSGNQFFYSTPDWANSPGKSIYLQNFHLWSRVITYKEVISAQPALALAPDFDVSGKPSSSCPA
jgi:hypothetical protein